MKKVVFMGTPDFAVPALKALIESDEYDVKLVISQPDKPTGRHQVLTPSPVKELALQYDIEVYQPLSLKNEEAFNKINSFAPDFIVVSAYGKILPQNVLDIPVYGCVNLHGSLLPKYRGAAPVQWAVINGDKTAGVTTMLMAAGLDTGDMLLRSVVEVGEEETAGELFDRLSALCPELLLKTLDGLAKGEIVPEKQDEAQASYVGMLTKQDAVIDWTMNAAVLHDRIRGLSPWPVAVTKVNSKNFKIHSSRVTGKTKNGACGEVFIENGALFVICGNNTVLQLCDVQPEGSRKMASSDFLRGHSFPDGFIFDSEG